jgi:hypothetical protein
LRNADALVSVEASFAGSRNAEYEVKSELMAVNAAPLMAVSSVEPPLRQRPALMLGSACTGVMLAPPVHTATASYTAVE